MFFIKTINCERFVQVILRQIFTELTEDKRLYGWFRQDSAAAHTARISIQALSIIGSGIWLACSPDLNPCDFFFWVCLKDNVYNSNP
jgi:hypothetical protein